jgi:hypothetical protein
MREEFIHHPDDLFWRQGLSYVVVIFEGLSVFEMPTVHLCIANLRRPCQFVHDLKFPGRTSMALTASNKVKASSLTIRPGGSPFSCQSSFSRNATKIRTQRSFSESDSDI